MNLEELNLPVSVRSGIIKSIETRSSTRVTGGGMGTNIHSDTYHRKNIEIDLDSGGFASLNYPAHELPFIMDSPITIMFYDEDSPLCEKYNKLPVGQILAAVDDRGRMFMHHNYIQRLVRKPWNAIKYGAFIFLFLIFLPMVYLNSELRITPDNSPLFASYLSLMSFLLFIVPFFCCIRGFRRNKKAYQEAIEQIETFMLANK